MTTINLETRIAAPAMRVFLLSLSVDLHTESTAQTCERAIAGVTKGIIGMGESVTWQGRHFGLVLKHTSLITRYEPPLYFEDMMTKGMFKNFIHRHTFHTDGGSTLVWDQLDFSAPLALLGFIAERTVLKNYLTRFLLVRNGHMKRIAESDEWLRYIPAGKRSICL